MSLERFSMSGRRGSWFVAAISVILVTPAAAQDAGTKAVAVKVAQVEMRPLVRELTMPATLLADERVDLYAKVSGYVSDVVVDIGSRVQADAVLARLAVPEMDEELQQAEAVLAARLAKVRAVQAQAEQAGQAIYTAQAEVVRWQAQHDLDQLNFARKQELRTANAIPEQDLDEARGRLAMSEAELQIARVSIDRAKSARMARNADVRVAEAEVAISQAAVARLRTMMGYSAIRAPFEGVITRRMIDHGTFVRSAAEGTTMPLLTIVKDDRIRLKLDIPESDARFLRVGTAVEVDIPSLPIDPIVAAVSRVAGALDPATRTMHVEVDLDNAAGQLMSGMYARVTLTLESKDSVMVIPSKALRSSGRDITVLVAQSGVASAVPIRVGYDDGIWAEIIAGLEGQEWIITSAGGSVGEGTAIEPVK